MRSKLVILVLMFCSLLNVVPVFAGLFDMPIEFKSIDLDVASHYPMEDFLVIKNKADLDRVVKACQDTSAIGRDIELPKIDFEKNMLIAVFGGRNTATSYSICIEDVMLIDDQIIVNVVKNGPERAIDHPNLTSPYHIIMLPKTALGVKFLIQGAPSEFSVSDCMRTVD